MSKGLYSLFDNAIWIDGNIDNKVVDKSNNLAFCLSKRKQVWNIDTEM